MTRPEITVGLPVFNGAAHLERAIQSVLTQTFRDLELIIVDNASTDDTQSIGLEASRADHRVRFIRQERNVGAVANFNRALEAASGRFFCWLAHDDWFDPSYLMRCVGELRSDHSLVLCSALMGVVDETGKVFREQKELLSDLDDPDPRRRFHRIIWSLQDPTSPIFGLMRTSTVRQLEGLPQTPEPDRQFLYALSLHGGFRAVRDVLFFHLGPPGHMAHYGSGPMRRRSWDWIHAPGTRKLKAASFRVLRYQLQVVTSSDMPFTDRVRCAVDAFLATAIRRSRSKGRRLARQYRQRHTASASS